METHIKSLSLGYSTCPNDTFIFHAATHNLAGAGAFGEDGPCVVLADVEELNSLALDKALDICKISAAVWPEVQEHYALLSCGGAMGHGVGPVLVAKEGTPATGLRNIAIPGVHTTAARLLRLFTESEQTLLAPDGQRPDMRFDRIVPALMRDEVDAGVLIHEGRFTYASLGLVLLQDLGQWWENYFSLPLPLGCIVARRSLGEERIARIEAAIRESLQTAWANPEQAMPYIRENAKELSEEAIRQHIETFVTKWSLDMGEEGRKALKILEQS